MNTTPIIISLNINQFCGSKSWSSNIDNDTKLKTINEILNYIYKNIKNNQDLIFLHELPYNNINLMNYLKLELEKNDYKIFYPQKLNEFCNIFYLPCEATIGIAKKNTNWNYDYEGSYSYSELFSKKENKYIKHKAFSNRVLDLYNNDMDIHVLGTHIPDATYRPEASVLWDDVKYYYNHLHHKCVYILGDLNVYKPNTIQNRKLYEIFDNGAKDVWIEFGNSRTTPTFNGITRVDYILSSPPAMLFINKMRINSDDIQNKDLSDHSAVELYLNINI